jgi:urease accessory protein
VNATVTIETALRGSMSFLKSCFCTPPFKVLDITEDSRNNILHLMLMSASPGVLDGDAHHFQIKVATGCSLQLHTQSYQRLFQMQNGALQQMEVVLEEGASFCFLPHPTVPHQRSSFTAINTIHLSRQCRLVWGEVLTCGRKGSGEAFTFSKYHSRTSIYMQGRLVVKENLLLQPSMMDISGVGQWEGYTHQASLLYMQEEILVAEVIANLHEWLQQQEGICFGITALPVNGVVVRILGYKGETLHRCLQQLAALLPGGRAASHSVPAKPGDYVR